MTENYDPIKVLTTDAKIAEWCNDCLPSDRKSIENGVIVKTSHRWPLLIDPQIQVRKPEKWLKPLFLCRD